MIEGNTWGHFKKTREGPRRRDTQNRVARSEFPTTHLNTNGHPPAISIYTYYYIDQTADRVNSSRIL